VFALQKWLRERATILRSTRYHLSCFATAKIRACMGGKHTFLNSNGTLAVMRRFTDFPQFFQESNKIVHRLGHVHFLQNYLEYSFTSHRNITLFVFEVLMVFPSVALQVI
jgi:hypothetical protein